ncbi:MAG: FAD-dependent oxidoreductase [Cyclobacteriaceae bacterium]
MGQRLFHSTGEFLNESPHKVPVIGKSGVVICGGGPSGIMAALAASRLGAKVILIEQYGFLGGMATAGLVGPISKFNFSGKRVVSGIPEEFIQKMHAMQGAIIDLPSGNIPYDPEIYKYMAMKMLLEHGVNLLLHTRIVGSYSQKANAGKITHVLIENKSGRQAIEADYFVDCTGTGDFIARTELPWTMRSNKKGELQPMSLYFRIGGVDTSSMELLMAEDNVKYRNQDLALLLQEEMEAGRLENFGGPWVVHGSTLRPCEVSVNATRFRGNAANGFDLSEAELILRKDVFTIWNLFKEKVPAFRNAYLIDTATQVGIRETRSIIGHYTMDEEDILTPKGFPDGVAMGAHPIDIHSSQTKGQKVKFLTAPYPISFRSMHPIGSINVLAAGGSVSATRAAYASIRVQAQCMALGQAAGTAVALCLREKLPIGQLDCAFLRHNLKEAGAIL